MTPEFNDVLDDLKKIPTQHQVKTIIIFGSVARGEAHSESDIDVCFILHKKQEKKEIADQILEIEKKHKRNINIITTTPTFEGLDRQFIETVLREGVVIFGNMPEISVQRLELEPYEIIRFDLSNLSQSQKMQIKRLLYGVKTKKEYKGKIYENEQKGLVEQFGGLRIGIASILVPEKASLRIEKPLRDYDIQIRKITIWLSKP